MEFKFTEEGFRHVVIAEDLKLLGSYLTEDVQSSVAWCDELLHIIQNVESGQLREWKGTGNAHTPHIIDDTVIIVNEYTEEVLQSIALSFFEETLKEWRKFITHDITT